jgi:hypothetical protein
MTPPPRIIRFDEPFDTHLEAAPARIIRNHAAPGEPDEQPFRLSGVLRGGQTTITAEACEIPLRTFEADFPLPAETERPKPPVSEAAIRAELDAEWRTRMEDTVLSVREEAYDAGYATAKQELEASINDTIASLAVQLATMRDAVNLHIGFLERTAVELAVGVSAAILDAPLTNQARLASERALAHAAETLAGDGSLEITLHPIDLLKVQESGLQEQLKSTFPELRWTPDESMAEGDWSARSPKAVIRRIRQEMLHLIAEKLGVAESETP